MRLLFIWFMGDLAFSTDFAVFYRFGFSSAAQLTAAIRSPRGLDIFEVAWWLKTYLYPVLSSLRCLLYGIFSLHILKLVQPIVELLAGVMLGPI